MKKLVLTVAFILAASLLLHEAAAAPNWTVWRDVQYGLTVQEKADLYLLNRGVNPVVGAWVAGDKSSYDGYYAWLYATAGFHVVAIN